MYETNQPPFPFWGAAVKSKSGRDPLAVQNSSVVIYTNMVKGITNVTTRVRYNGFFCWLLDLITRNIFNSEPSKVDNIDVQIELIKRGELLLAYAMCKIFPVMPEGVSGSQYVQHHIELEDIIDLASGTGSAADDQNNKEDIYWQNPRGVFGQYYLGVMTQLKLLRIPDSRHNTYRPTDEGLKLANCFGKSLSEYQEKLFWDSIISGKVNKNQLVEFKGISLHLIDNSEELSLYNEIFSRPDYEGKEVCHRIKTIKLLLDFIDKSTPKAERKSLVLSFLKDNYQKVVDSHFNVSDERISWFLYELNELTHAAFEAFHFAVLNTITDEPRPLSDVLEDIKSAFNDVEPNYAKSLSIYELYDKLQGLYKKRDCGRYLKVASFLLLSLYNSIKKQIDLLFDHAKKENYDVTHPGFAPSFLSSLFRRCPDVGGWEFAEYCIYRAINQHLRSSFSKSAIGQGLVHNYMIDDGLIWRLRKVEPVRTSPRLENMLRYIEDLKWIESSDTYYILTQQGRIILEDDRTKTTHKGNS